MDTISFLLRSKTQVRDVEWKGRTENAVHGWEAHKDLIFLKIRVEILNSQNSELLFFFTLQVLTL